MADKDLSSTQVGATKEKRPGACKRHCAKWWWLHLIIFVVGAVVIVVVAIFAVTPRIAQDKIDAANLEIQAVSISNPTPTGFHMKIDSTITTDGQVKAQIDPFEGAMYLAGSDKPFLNLPFPPTNADKFQTVNVSADITIQDMDEFIKFNTVFITNETVTITIKGYTYVQPRGLSKKYGVNFSKTVDFKGLNSFKGNQVADAKSDLTNNAYPNFNATAKLPNPSYYTIDLGNATFTNYAPDGTTELGIIHINNFFLQPGMNDIPVKGNLSLGPVTLIASNVTNCNKALPFQLKGKSVEYNGQNLTYFATALEQAPTIVNINLTEVGKTDPVLNKAIDAICK